MQKLVDAVRRSGKLYMMNETTAFRPECYAMFTCEGGETLKVPAV